MSRQDASRSRGASSIKSYTTAARWPPFVELLRKGTFHAAMQSRENCFGKTLDRKWKEIKLHEDIVLDARVHAPGQ